MDPIAIAVSAVVVALIAAVYAIFSLLEINYHRNRARNLADTLRSITADASGPRRRTYWCSYDKTAKVLRVYARIADPLSGCPLPGIPIFEGSVPDAKTAITTGNKIVAALLSAYDCN